MPFGTRVRSVGLVGGAVLLVGCAAGNSTQTAAAPETGPRSGIRTVNSKCPMSGLPVDADAPVAMYRNAVVGFCCPLCVEPWTQLSDGEKFEILARIAPGTELGHRRTPPRNPFR